MGPGSKGGGFHGLETAPGRSEGHRAWTHERQRGRRMSKEPDSRKQPDEERDDILGDDIEEIDLDALLADDGLDTALTGKAAPEPASGKSDAEAFLDSEVLDLGSGEEEVETLSADDLLEL